MTVDAQPRGRLLVVVAVVALVFAASAAPLIVYATSLSLFGLAHVAYETRYVDGRFGGRLARRLLVVLAALSVAIVLSRALFSTRVLPAGFQATTETTLLALFALAALPPGGLRGITSRGAGAVACVAGLVLLLAGGAVLAPAATLAVFSLLHNVTPIGFLVEAAPAAERRGVALRTSLLLIGVPLLVALGAGEALLGVVGLSAHEGAPFSVGSLRDHLVVYVPKGVDMPWARQLFSAAVVAQVMHYVATIVLFPRAAARNGDEGHLFPWPSPRVFAATIVVLSLVLLVGFVGWFRDARALYGIPAAFHAWIEIPLLLLAFSSFRGAAGAQPARSVASAA